MKEFLQKLAAAIVSDPQTVEIREGAEEGLKIYTIVVPEEEVGKIIGKEGRVINSIRCLARLKAMKEGERVIVKVEGNQMGKGLSLPTSTEEGDSTEAGAR